MEEQVLLATSRAVTATARSADVSRHSHGQQRSDDMVVVPPPAAGSPDPFETHLPIPEPLPAPSPLGNPLIDGYVAQNCTEETWPFFVNVTGTWIGDQGQNFIALPQANARPAGKDFLVQVNAYNETLEFQPTGPVLNRGYLDGVQVPPVYQSDQVFMGVMYHQEVTDMDLNEKIHKENGMFLHQACTPMNGQLMDDWQVSRLGAIPHGSQPMGFGNMTIENTPDDDYYIQMLIRLRETYEFSVQPFVPGCGPQADQQRPPRTNSGPFAEANGTAACCIGGAGYMQGTDQCPPTGCPEPIDMLIDAVRGLNVVKYVQLNLTTGDTIGPYMPQGMWRPGIRGGGVQNTAFVNVNVMAESESFRNMVWYLTVKREDGSTYDLIQYIETVNLKFLAKQAGCPDQMWPHVDANTLRRAGMPPPEPTPEPSPAGNCYNKFCGCKRPKWQAPWCSHDRCSLGPWCSKSEGNCQKCMGAWCPESY